jgi:hypothetical protein
MQNNTSSNFDGAPTGSRHEEGEEEASMNFSFLMEEASLGSFPAYVASSAAAAKKPSEPLRRHGEEQDEEEASEQYEDDMGQGGGAHDEGQEDPRMESSTLIRASVNSRNQASQFSQRSLLLEEGSAHTGDDDFDRGDLQDVDLKGDHGQDTTFKQAKDDQDDDDDQDKDQQSVMSDSVGEEEASTVDLAEEAEKRNRKSVFLALFTACGIIFVLTLITRYCNRSKDEDQVAEIVAEEAAQEVGDQAGGMAMRGALLAKQQSVANLANPAYL